jgi:hypothetical protein
VQSQQSPGKWRFGMPAFGTDTTVGMSLRTAAETKERDACRASKE